VEILRKELPKYLTLRKPFASIAVSNTPVRSEHVDVPAASGRPRRRSSKMQDPNRRYWGATLVRRCATEMLRKRQSSSRSRCNVASASPTGVEGSIQQQQTLHALHTGRDERRGAAAGG